MSKRKRTPAVPPKRTGLRRGTPYENLVTSSSALVGGLGRGLGSILSIPADIISAPARAAGSAAGTVMGGGSLRDARDAATSEVTAFPTTQLVNRAADDAKQTYDRAAGVEPGVINDTWESFYDLVGDILAPGPELLQATKRAAPAPIKITKAAKESDAAFVAQQALTDGATNTLSTEPIESLITRLGNDTSQAEYTAIKKQLLRRFEEMTDEEARALIDNPNLDMGVRDILAALYDESNTMWDDALTAHGGIAQALDNIFGGLADDIDLPVSKRGADPYALPARPPKDTFYYDNIENAMSQWKQPKGRPDEVLAHFKKYPGTLLEADAIGMTGWLKGKRSVTKQEVLSFLEQNRIDLHVNERRAVPEGVDPRKLKAFEREVWDNQATLEDQLKELKESLGGADPYTDPWYADPDVVTKRSAIVDQAERELDAIKQRHGVSEEFYDRWVNEHRDSVTGTKWDTYRPEELVLPDATDYRETLLRVPERSPYVTPSGPPVNDPSYLPSMHKQFDIVHPDTGEVIDTVFEDQAKGMADSIKRPSAYGYRVNYRSPHWNESNVIAHNRTSERVLPDGRRVLLGEETQSDLHQQGRRTGYMSEFPRIIKRRDELYAQQPAVAQRTVEAYDELANIKSRMQAEAGFDKYPRIPDSQLPQTPELLAAKARYKEASDAEVALLKELRDLEDPPPDLPFKGDQWRRLAVREMLHRASKEGYDAVGWTRGNVQQHRYSDLPEKEKAGLGKNYDQIMPITAKDELRPFGNVQPENVQVPIGAQTGMQPSDATIFDLTPELRDAITRKRFRLFNILAPGAGVGAAAASATSQQPSNTTQQTQTPVPPPTPTRRR
jgi:hypothetical protein